jgi:hypothetical protein
MISAVTRHPEMVYGTNGFCTELMKEFSGRVIGKRGAAGVYLSGVVGGGIGCAVKIDDGAMGPQYNVTMELLHWLWGQNKLQSPPLPALRCSSREEGEGQGDQQSNEDLLRQKFESLERFRVAPSCNSMGVLVGATRCVEELFPQLESNR